MPDTLRYVELNIVPNVSCVANLAMVNIAITDKMLCTFKVIYNHQTGKTDNNSIV